jgi:hypothetical protein
MIEYVLHFLYRDFNITWSIFDAYVYALALCHRCSNLLTLSKMKTTYWVASNKSASVFVKLKFHCDRIRYPSFESFWMYMIRWLNVELLVIVYSGSQTLMNLIRIVKRQVSTVHIISLMWCHSNEFEVKDNMYAIYKQNRNP